MWSYGPSEYFKHKNPELCKNILSLPPTELQEFDVKFLDDSIKAHFNNIDSVNDVIRGRYYGLHLYALGVVIRRNWYPVIQEVVHRQIMHLNQLHTVTINQMNFFLESSHMCRDKVHLNSSGYSVFLDKGLGPLLDSHYDALRKPKCERNRIPVSKSATRRRKNAKKKVSLQ